MKMNKREAVNGSVKIANLNDYDFGQSTTRRRANKSVILGLLLASIVMTWAVQK